MMANRGHAAHGSKCIPSSLSAILRAVFKASKSALLQAPVFRGLQITLAADSPGPSSNGFGPHEAPFEGPWAMITCLGPSRKWFSPGGVSRPAYLRGNPQREGEFPAMGLGGVLSPEFVKSGVGPLIAGRHQVLNQLGFALDGMVG